MLRHAAGLAGVSFLASWALAPAAHGQVHGPAAMVVDLVTRSLDFPSPFTPFASFAPLGDRFLLVFSDGVHGEELWETDGTTGGTRMVRDICPGICNGAGSWDYAVHGGRVYFPGNDGVHGEELWASDGTPQGTRMVVDQRPGPESSNPVWIRSLGSTLFWLSQARLWAWSGDGPPTPVVGGSGAHGPLIVVGERLLLGVEGHLWSVDEALTLTPILIDSLSIQWVGSPVQERLHPWAVHQGKLYFTGETAAAGREPWISDGTSAGTVALGDLRPGPLGSGGTHFFLPLGNDVLFFAAPDNGSRDLWITDGTGAGTRPVYDFGSGSGSRLLAADAGRALLLVHHPDTGLEPWISDGTEAGTTLLRDIRPGPESSQADLALIWLTEARVANGLFFFPADDGVHGDGPWITDGTEVGTRPLAPSEGAARTLHLGWYGEVAWTGNELLFVPFELTASESFGRQLWVSDGTPEGTHRVATHGDPTNGFFPCFLSVTPCPLLLPVAGKLFFTALLEMDTLPESAERLYVLQGTAGSTTRLVVENAEGEESQVLARSTFQGSSTPAVVGRQLLFLPNFDPGVLWRSDGTQEGTAPLWSFGEPEESHPLGPLVPFGSGAAFGVAGSLWTTDGFEEGTSPVGTAAPPYESHVARPRDDFLATGSGLYYTLPDGEVWRLGLDGTPGFVADLPGAAQPTFLGTLPPVAAEGAERLVLWHDDKQHGVEPWVLGEPGASRLADVHPGLEGSRVAYALDVWSPDLGGFHLAATTSDLVFFVADDGTTGPVLWQTDGTAAGTRPTLDSFRQPRYPRWLTAVGDRVFFSAYRPGTGQELWVTNGTPWGTRRLEIAPGEASSIPSHLVAIEDELFFAAFHPDTGVELWRSDGTPAGTRLFQDIHPGPGSSSPVSLTMGAGQLWLVANDGAHGFELWAAPLVEIFADGFESGGLLEWSEGEP
jgi:ELWxxDGT repeat protein